MLKQLKKMVSEALLEDNIKTVKSILLDVFEKLIISGDSLIFVCGFCIPTRVYENMGQYYPDQKIPAIKYLRTEIKDIGLKEAKDIADHYWAYRNGRG
jgi:hypothetical protein